jgi:hypothetical protein
VSVRHKGYLMTKRGIVYFMAINWRYLLQRALESVTVLLFTQLAFIFALFLFNPIFKFPILISQFV